MDAVLLSRDIDVSGILGSLADHSRLVASSDSLVYKPNPTSHLLAAEARTISSKAARALDILDLGTGSGIVAIAAASASLMHDIVAVDISPSACNFSRAAIKDQGLLATIYEGDWFEPVAGRTFDVIFSHPPAVPYPDKGSWGFSNEMTLATNGGNEGVDCFEFIIENAKYHLKNNGKLILGVPHWANVKKIRAMLGKSFSDISTLSVGEAPFFPMSDGFPSKETIVHFWSLVDSQIIDAELREGVIYSPVSVISATF